MNEYPKKAISKAGLNQKRKNSLQTLGMVAPSELRTHDPAVFPWEHQSGELTKNGGFFLAHHAFQAMRNVDMTLVQSIGPATITATLPSSRFCSP